MSGATGHPVALWGHATGYPWLDTHRLGITLSEHGSDLRFPIRASHVWRVGVGGLAGLSKTRIFSPSPHGGVHGVSPQPTPATPNSA
jgi:hypothetical protein